MSRLNSRRCERVCSILEIGRERIWLLSYVDDDVHLLKYKYILHRTHTHAYTSAHHSGRPHMCACTILYFIISFFFLHSLILFSNNFLLWQHWQTWLAHAGCRSASIINWITIMSRRNCSFQLDFSCKFAIINFSFPSWSWDTPKKRQKKKEEKDQLEVFGIHCVEERRREQASRHIRWEHSTFAIQYSSRLPWCVRVCSPLFYSRQRRAECKPHFLPYTLAHTQALKWTSSVASAVSV